MPSDFLVSFFAFAGGVLLLVWGSDKLVEGASATARSLCVSPMVIGLTVVAVGTSLPELATSVMSAIRDEPDLALGNILGSNMFNLLGVLGAASVIQPHSLDSGILRRDMTTMIGLSVALFFMAAGNRGNGRVNRWEGALLLGGYLGYTSLLCLGFAG